MSFDNWRRSSKVWTATISKFRQAKYRLISPFSVIRAPSSVVGAPHCFVQQHNHWTSHQACTRLSTPKGKHRQAHTYFAQTCVSSTLPYFLRLSSVNQPIMMSSYFYTTGSHSEDHNQHTVADGIGKKKKGMHPFIY